MSFTDTSRNAMVAADPTTHLSLHTAYSSTGTNEVTGGSPAYARKSVTWGAPASAARSASNTPTFDVPAAATVRFIGKWDALTSGNFLGMVANGGTELEFSVDPATETFTSPAHGFVNTQKVVFYGDTVPAGLTEGTVYFVIGATTDTFQVSATSGGSAVNITALPGRKCVVAAIVEEAFAAQGTMAVSPYTQRADA